MSMHCARLACTATCATVVGWTSRHMPPDLRAIIAKATREEPQARYASAAELRTDVDNFLAHRAVLARDGGALYRTRRFVQRHVWTVAVAKPPVA